MVNQILPALAGIFLNKKRIISWISSVVIVAGAAAAGMQNAEFKEAVCGATIIKMDEAK